MLDLTEQTQPAQITNSAYHARPELGASQIKTILKNPYEYLFPKQKSGAQFSIGSAVHKLILEAHDFDKEFAVAPEVNKRTKEGKASFAAFEEAAAGKTVLSHDDHTLSKSCADSVLQHEEAKVFLSDGAAEMSFFGKINDVPVKCRPDYYRPDLGIVVDVKTTQDASPDGFIKDVANFGYYIQAAFYLDVLKSLGYPAHKFLFIVVEKKEPFMVGMYELDPVALDFGRDEYLRAFEIWRNIDHFATPIYKDTKDETVVQTLTLPSWVYYRKNAS